MGAITDIANFGIQTAAGNEQAAADIRQARFNENLAHKAAVSAIERGNREAGLTRIQGTKLIGAQKLAYANSGIDASVGTPVDVMADTRLFSEIDAKTIETNARLEAWGFRSKASQFKTMAENVKRKNDYAMAARTVNLVGSLASGGLTSILGGSGNAFGNSGGGSMQSELDDVWDNG